MCTWGLGVITQVLLSLAGLVVCVRADSIPGTDSPRTVDILWKYPEDNTVVTMCSLQMLSSWHCHQPVPLLTESGAVWSPGMCWSGQPAEGLLAALCKAYVVSTVQPSIPPDRHASYCTGNGTPLLTFPTLDINIHPSFWESIPPKTSPSACNHVYFLGERVPNYLHDDSSVCLSNVWIRVSQRAILQIQPEEIKWLVLTMCVFFSSSMARLMCDYITYPFQLILLEHSCVQLPTRYCGRLSCITQ